jgi:hypothetical protein
MQRLADRMPSIILTNVLGRFVSRGYLIMDGKIKRVAPLAAPRA